MRSERGICRAVDEGGAHASSEQQASYHERLLPRVETRFLALFYTRCPNFQTIGTEHTQRMEARERNTGFHQKTEWLLVKQGESEEVPEEDVHAPPSYSAYPAPERYPDMLPPDYPAILSLLFSVFCICWSVGVLWFYLTSRTAFSRGCQWRSFAARLRESSSMKSTTRKSWCLAGLLTICFLIGSFCIMGIVRIVAFPGLPPE